MRIGLFTDAYMPIISGVSVSVETLAKELRKKGHVVYVITHAHEDAIDDEFVIRLRGVPLPMKGMHEYKIGKVTRKQVKRLLSYAFDIVHCHTEFTMGRLGRRMAKKAGIPVVHTYHTMYEDYVHFISKSLVIPLRFIAKLYSKHFANTSDAVIFPTIKVKKTFDGYGYKGNGHIIPTGIYLDKFKAPTKERLDTLRTHWDIPDNAFVLLFLGRVSREKSIQRLIEQVALLPHPDMLLLIVGDGPDRPSFEKQVNKLGIRDKVRFTGMVPPSEVGDYYHLGDVFVNFSVTETQGLTYIEALASGLPLVVKYDKNLEGVIEQGVNGYTFESNEEFLPYIEQLYQDKTQLSTMAEHARHALEQFSAMTYANRVEAIYESLYKG